MSSKLFRISCGFIVVMLVAAFLYSNILTKNHKPWHEVGFETLKGSMQKGIVDLHWEWQRQGRPSYLTVANGNQRVEMNADGWPKLVASVEACSNFLKVFVANESVDVSFLSIDVDVQSQLGIEIDLIKVNDSENEADICRYRREGQEFKYQLGTGNVL